MEEQLHMYVNKLEALHMQRHIAIGIVLPYHHKPSYPNFNAQPYFAMLINILLPVTVCNRRIC